MTQVVVNLGEIGVAGVGVLRPFALTLERGATVWDLTGYTNPTIQVWDLPTRTKLATPGQVQITSAGDGEVTWTPGASVNAASGVYECRIFAIPADGGDPEPSGLFRFSIAAGGVDA